MRKNGCRQILELISASHEILGRIDIDSYGPATTFCTLEIDKRVKALHLDSFSVPYTAISASTIKGRTYVKVAKSALDKLRNAREMRYNIQVKGILHNFDAPRTYVAQAAFRRPAQQPITLKLIAAKR